MPDEELVPLVSIGIPTFNRRESLIRAVMSVLRQDYSRVEIVISDNASSDGTQEACRRLVEGDGRIRYYRQSKNVGPIPNFASVLEQSRGPFFIWLADDDTLEPRVLSRYVRFLVENPDHVLVSGTVRYWDRGSIFMKESGFTFQEEQAGARVRAFYRKVTAGGIFHGLMRREVAAGVPLHNVIGSDWCFIAALLMAGKIKQFDFAAYNKSLIGLSLNFEQYAAVVGASHLGRCNPILAMICHAWVQPLVDWKSYRSLPALHRVRLSISIGLSLLWRLYLRILFTDPRRFLRLSIRSAVKTLVPPKLIRLLRRGPCDLPAGKVEMEPPPRSL